VTRRGSVGPRRVGPTKPAVLVVTPSIGAGPLLIGWMYTAGADLLGKVVPNTEARRDTRLKPSLSQPGHVVGVSVFGATQPMYNKRVMTLTMWLVLRPATYGLTVARHINSRPDLAARVAFQAEEGVG
jgi:hypothetical protein